MLSNLNYYICVLVQLCAFVLCCFFSFQHLLALHFIRLIVFAQYLQLREFLGWLLFMRANVKFKIQGNYFVLNVVPNFPMIQSLSPPPTTSNKSPKLVMIPLFYFTYAPILAIELLITICIICYIAFTQRVSFNMRNIPKEHLLA